MTQIRVDRRRHATFARMSMLACAACPICGVAAAQEARDFSGDIVVTAAKRAEAAATVPAAITVVTADDLDATGTRDFAGLAKLVPGLSYVDSGPGNKRYALRGLQSAGEPEVALYYDDVPISGLPGSSLDTGDSQLDLQLWDIERIEILKGPQGTLYGNGSMGGAIRILSRRPDLTSFDAAGGADFGLTAGGAPNWSVKGALNVPLVPSRLAIRVAGYFDRQGGWIDQVPQPGIRLPQIAANDINGSRTAGGRISAQFAATPRWRITGIASFQRLRSEGPSELYPDFAVPGDPYRAQAYVRKPWRDDAQLYELLSELDLDWADVTLIGSYQHRAVDRTIDTTRFLLSNFGCTEFSWLNGCAGPSIVPAASYTRETVSAWSGEARLSSRTGSPLQWTVGAFAQTSGTLRLGQVATVDPSGDVTFLPSGVAERRLFARTNRDTFDQQAVFGELSFQPVARLRATAGFRWFRSERSDAQTILQQFFPGAPVGPQPFQRFDQARIFKKVALDYSLPRLGLVYVTASQGFRAGGPNYPGGFDLVAPPYRADSVWNYEIGWKLKLLDRKLYWDGAIFDIEWRNLQQLIPQKLFSYIANVGRARSRGFETSLEYRPNSAWRLTAALAYNHAALIGPQPVTTDPQSQVKSGDRLANVPDWSGNFSIAWARPLGRNDRLGIRLDAQFQSSRDTTVAKRSAAYERLGGFWLADAHLEFARGRDWQLSLDVTNLFNRYALLSGKALDSNLVQTVTAARPRTAAMRVSWRL